MKSFKKTNSELFPEDAWVKAPSLPDYPAANGADETAGAEQDLPVGTETILFVDDEAVILEVNRDILEFLGYRVFTANSGYEAVDIYREKGKEIDLVIQDMVMPGMNGAETFHALKKMNPAIKVILASGYVMNKQIGAVMQQGCRAFMQKPFRLEDLAFKVREILDSP
ncbi:MAG: response regulator [Smithellaceae bacterium]